MEEACALSAAAEEEEQSYRDETKSAPATFRIAAIRQLSSVSEQGLRKFRLECETANDAIAAYVAKQNDDRRQAQRWVKAVKDAAKRPENEAIIAELRRASKTDAEFRPLWAKINGASAPEIGPEEAKKLLDEATK